MVTLFGIKNCDTVKKACKWLNSNSIQYQFHDFRVDGLDQNQVSGWTKKIGMENLLNKRSTTWKQMSEIDKHRLLNTGDIKIIVANPTVIKRPVLVRQNEILVGFDSDRYKQLFSV